MQPFKEHNRRRWLLRDTILALLYISGGIMLGYWLHDIHHNRQGDFGINERTPIPPDVFTTRHDVAFIPDLRYIGPSKEVSHNWKKLTKGSDSIFIPTPQGYGLQDPGIHAPFFIFNDPPEAAKKAGTLNNFYVLNSLHQLHCVHMIHRRYNQLVYASNNTTPLSGSPLDSDWITHLEHCFEYLRLSITCGDYMVFESDSPPGSPEEYWKDGLSWGVVHSCIDWDGLMAFQAKQVAAYNSTWEGKI